MSISALLLAAAVPPTAAPLVPQGPWTVREDENLCRLERVYPHDGKDMLLAFQPLLDLHTIELLIASTDSGDRQISGRATVTVTPGERTYTGSYFSVPSTTRRFRVARLTVNRDLLTDLRDGDVVHVDAKPVDASFTIVRPDKARETLAGCVADLKKSWGIDPDVAAQTVSQPEGNPARFFSTDSYPTEALRRGIYGRVIALLNIDAGGAVANCRIVSSAGKELNDGTCRVAQRIRFKPAQDKDGKPLASTYLLPVRWVLPG